MFDIRIERRGGPPIGEIIIGDFREHFAPGLMHWTLADYRASWLRGAARILELGYGRFLIAVDAPGEGLWETWACWSMDGRVACCKSILLPSLTESYAAPQDAETPPEDDLARGVEEPGVDYQWCALEDIADFERRLRGDGVQ